MAVWTPQNVIALAPDSASASAGQGLASRGNWQSTGRSPRAIWGLCQGSGKNPYQTRIDLGEPAFKCSCPSRKFPCKHGLGLLLLYAADPSGFLEAPEPDWVSEWLEGRTERATKKIERQEAQTTATPDPETQAKRTEERVRKVGEGIAHARLWLDDLARRGLAEARADPATAWHTTAARMVDAQANGLAGMIRRVPEVLASGPGWETRAADWLGRLHLLLAAGERAAELPEDLGQTVRTALGFTTPAARVLSTEPVSDRWVVLGQAFEDEDKLRARRTWLIGRATGRRALLLDFAPGGRPFDVSPVPGTEFDGALCFYPGRLALRAVIHEQGEASAYLGRVDRADSGVKDGLARHAQAMALDPWLRQWPMYIEGLCPARSGDRWFVSDPSGCSLPLRPSFRSSHAFWKWLSVTGGASIGTLFEWDGASATPLSVRDNSGHVDLTTGWAT